MNQSGVNTMIKTLVAIEVDLASSLAIRYACQLGNLVNLEIYPVYVKEPPSEAPTTGVGWVRRTWEREIVAAGQEEIQEMLASEMESCPVLQEPRVIYGDREYELLKIMEHEPFDLYVEGAPYPFTPANIHHRLHQKFYQHLGTPMIWLRTLRKINQLLVVCQDPAAVRTLLPAIRRLWTGCPTPVHLGVPPAAGDSEALRLEVETARAELAAAGCQVSVKEIPAQTAGESRPEVTKEYGLVAVCLERDVKKDGPQFQWLSQVKAPLMVVLR
jgi:hypothetical protein